MYIRLVIIGLVVGCSISEIDDQRVVEAVNKNVSDQTQQRILLELLQTDEALSKAMKKSRVSPKKYIREDTSDRDQKYLYNELCQEVR